MLTPVPSMSTPRSYPFAIANAFSQDAFGGNPATIVFLDQSNTPTQEDYLKFAKGFNQPIITFLTLTSTAAGKPGVVSFDARYFSPASEVGLCGHGTIAAMKVILDSATNLPGFGSESRFPAFSSPETHTVEFTTKSGVVVSSRKVVIPDEVSGEEEDWFEIVLPAGKLKRLPAGEEERVLGLFTRAVGKDPKIKYIGMGEPPFQRDLLIVLDESENVEQLKVDARVLVSKPRVSTSSPRPTSLVKKFQTETGFEKHIVTSDSTSGKFTEDYIVRMFAPAAGIDEDHVCGSASCTTSPYWATEKGITELKARQVSERGGRLRVGMDGDNIKLCGQVRVTSVGRLFL